MRTPRCPRINCIPLRSDETRRWVVTVLWEAERPDNSIPARYLTRNGD